MKKVLCFTFLLGVIASGLAQPKDVRERAFVQLSNGVVLSGETLHFAAFVRSAATGNFSELSSILYVELLNSDNEPVFQKKIRLEQGRGHGSHFVSTLVPTGTYRLIAYTRWMRNFGDYFQTPVVLVNPFENYQRPKPAPLAEAVRFFPEGGKLLPDEQNLLAFEVKGLRPNGRLVNGAGEKVADLLADEQGWGRVFFEPQASERYQAIFEDQQGQFQFFDLPATDAGAIVPQLRVDKDGYRIRLLAAQEHLVVLKVSDGQNNVLRRETYTNVPVALSIVGLQAGAYRLTVSKLTGELLSERLFFHQPARQLVTQPVGIGTFTARSLVSVPLELENTATVAVSVRKKEFAVTQPTSLSNDWYARVGTSGTRNFQNFTWEEMDSRMLSATWQTEDLPKEVALLPDYRGELISGRITSSSDLPIVGKTVSFSISGEKYQFWVDVTDSTGRFAWQMNAPTGPRDAYMRVWEDGNYQFDLDAQFLTAYPPFLYEPVVLDSTTIASLVERSVRNQIENAYYELKKDSVKEASIWYPFTRFNYFYRLDDYNRFPQLHEHFVEYIPAVVARKNESRSKVRVLLQNPVSDDLDPLILLDGVPVTARELLEINPYHIESIGVENNRFFHGPLMADGVVALHTFEKNLQGLKDTDRLHKLSYQGLDPITEYRFPVYDRQSVDRLPDFRDLLYWNPQLQVQPGSKLEFFTGDTSGIFEVIVEGYDTKGKPVSIRRTFEVKEGGIGMR